MLYICVYLILIKMIKLVKKSLRSNDIKYPIKKHISNVTKGALDIYHHIYLWL